MPTSNNNEVTLKEIRETYYSLRNFEISNLWQRSVFLSAILVLFYSGYGYLVSKFLDEEAKNPLLLHELCCAIALLAIVFSIIWIMMAKGSKACYEVYENKICEIEESEELKISEDHRMGSKCIPWDLDQCLFSNHGGRYSVSKLNILIGKVLLINWTIVLIIHYIGALLHFDHNDCRNCIVNTIILTIIPIVFLTILLTACFNLLAKSNALIKEGEEEKITAHQLPLSNLSSTATPPPHTIKWRHLGVFTLFLLTIALMLRQGRKESFANRE